MVTLHGIYGKATVFPDTLETSASEQIKTFCDQPYSAWNRIRIMPVDIGCAILTVKLAEKSIDLPKLDRFIRQNIPYGRDVRSRPHRSHGRLNIYDLRCIKKIDIRRSRESLGTLGGGNHFIEIDSDGENLYLVIHTGSRNLGLRVADYY